ncbi:MAG TPA: hypothetical protein VLG11_01375 [Candidatus Saccharimonadales bacterium]|nr:hypothetical protein [Candidatus Saccharimonadales bacterium]
MNKKLLIIIITAAIVIIGAGAYITLRRTGNHTAANTTNKTGSAQPRKTANGAVHISEYSNGDGAGASVIITGAVGDFGESISVNPNGAINLEHNSQATLALSQGSFRLDVSGLDKNIVDAFTKFQSNPTTCSGHITATGTAPIVAGSGTGAYQGISGSFNLSVLVDEIDTACGADQAYLAQAFILNGDGNVTFK